jgi:hypothetical protein
LSEVDNPVELHNHLKVDTVMMAKHA